MILPPGIVPVADLADHLAGGQWRKEERALEVRVEHRCPSSPRWPPEVLAAWRGDAGIVDQRDRAGRTLQGPCGPWPGGLAAAPTSPATATARPPAAWILAGHVRRRRRPWRS